MLENKIFGVCQVSISPIRATPSDESEIVSQLLFGETVEIIEVNLPWANIKCIADGYEGWLDLKQIIQLNQTEYQHYYELDKTVCSAPLCPIEAKEGFLQVTFGATIPSQPQFNVGSKYFKWSGIHNKVSLIKAAEHFNLAPYLWGGRSIFGVDCSGFIQIIFSTQNICLPRDASQQVEIGRTIPYDQHQSGDVAFFINEKGKIHHVGLILAENLIMHASGWVRKDELRKSGIFRLDQQKETHKLYTIKRFI
jgi:cell wall-associated NlpC family hydrolase